jgi:hypothetical protein
MMIWGMSTVTLSGVVGFVILVAGRLGLVATTLKPDDRMGAVVSLLFNKTIAAYLFGIALIILTVRVLTWEMRLLGEQLYSSAWNLRMTPSLPRANGEYLNVILNTPFWAVALLASGLALFGIAMSYLINPNQFSLQAMYRERLMRVFLGASNKRRNPNPFTGFDETDNILVRQLWVEEKSGRRLFPVINMTLNLIGRRILGSRTQLSESFTVSPLHCGSKDLGYRKSQGGSDDAHYAGGVSLGKAMAMSGAATSPNMGYYTSPLVRLVFTLLNVRFGEWLGNPGPAGRKTFNLRSPNFSAGPIIADTVGLSSAQSPYVPLSDGRHFESLGVYEMVLRRCHYIVVSDASCDPECSFADLGEAVRKIRSDFGIPIEFGAVTIYPRSAIDMLKMPGHNCTIGRIRYSLADGPDAPDGILVYIKPAYYGDEPRDVDVYARRNKYFPHEDTSGRPFTDSQFESYRMLAAYTMRKLCSDHDEEDLDCFIRDILSCHLAMEAPDWLAALLERSTNVPRSS